jgi:lipopolysaccharide transport system ATP-binding protein
MSSERLAICVESLSKRYDLYQSPARRLQHLLVPERWRTARLQSHRQEFWALRGVSCDIARGETVGVIGHNGSGKSTLLQIICGTLSATSGSVAVDGRVAALLELGSGFNPEYSGRENVYINCGILGLTREQVDARFAAIAEFADIGSFIEQPVKTYSSGMFARLAFAAAIHVDPDILIVDEALSVGDFAFQFKCLRRLKEMADGGCTVLFVTHDIEQVQKLCNRALYLRKGKAVFFGDAREACNRYLADERLANAAAADTAAAPALLTAGEGAADVADLHARHARFADRVAPHRRGTREAAEILLVQVNGESDREPQIVFGETVTVAVDFVLRRPLGRPTIAMYAIDAAGQLIAGTNSAYENQDLSLCLSNEPYRLTLSFENRLRNGRFGVQVFLVDFSPGTSTDYLDYIDLATSFISLPTADEQRWAWYSPRFESRLGRPED